jgi:DNA primase
MNFDSVITPGSIRNILDATRIEEVISDYVSLKRRGANFTGLCPFHNERTPSFSVSASKGIYKCFGCGKGGDAVNFLMEHEHFTYPEALRHLAKKFNISIEETETDSNVVEQQKEAESLYIVNKFAQEYYQKNLHDSEEGKLIGLSYFNERKFSSAIIQRFGLGYAFDKGDSLYAEATKAGYNKDVLIKAGLIGESESRVYDFFRGRVIFPIHNLSGKVIAFAGRVMKKNEKTAKYINSKETEVYNKSKILYAIHLARESMRHKDECLLTEGYADVITMHQFGFENTVASSGTSLTSDQVRLIKRFTSNITFIYDGDQAGINATLRGLDIALEEGLNVKICIIPDGDDPDSYLNKNGAAAMQHLLLNESKSFLHFQAELKIKSAGNDPVKKSAAILDIIKTIALIGEPVKRNLFIKQLSVLVEMNEGLMISEVNKARALLLTKNLNTTENIKSADIAPPTLYDNHTQKQFSDTELILENELIKSLILFGNYMWDENIKVAEIILKELDDREWINSLNEKVFRIYVEAFQIGEVPTLHDMLHHENHEIQVLAQRISGEKYQLSARWENNHHIYIPRIEENYRKDIDQVLNRLKLCVIRNLIEENREQLLKAQETNDIDKVNNCIVMKSKLDKMHNELSKKMGMIIGLPRK